MVMNESNENYLETILVLNHRLGNVRSVDIANEMNFYELVIFIEEDKDAYVRFILTGEM